MGAGGWLLTVMLFGCAGAAVMERPSPAGLTTITVEGEADSVVLVDPLGRTSWSESEVGDNPIPRCDRSDGGANYDLDAEEAGEGGELPGDVVTMIVLERPIVGRYRLYATAKGVGNLSIEVTPEGPTNPAARACHAWREIKGGAGRYVWNIDFLADTGRGACPFRMSRGGRAPAKNRPK